MPIVHCDRSPCGRRRSTTSIRSTLVACALLLVAGSRHAIAQAPLGSAKTDSPVTLEEGAAFVTLDFTKKDDKTTPILRFAYQSIVGDATRKARAANPAAEIRNVPFYSLSLAGTPTGDVAHIIGDGNVSNGADIQLSLGRAYLFSYATPRNVSVAEADIGALAGAARALKARREAIAAQLVEPVPDAAIINAAKNTIAQLVKAVTDYRTHIVGKLAAATTEHERTVLGAALDYADAILKFSAYGGAEPVPLDALAIVKRRAGPLYDALYVRVGLNAGSATLFDATKPFADQFSKKDYNGYSAQIGYSIRFGGSLPIIAAVSGGMLRTSNVDDLTAVEVTETQAFASVDGVTKRGTSRKRTGLTGVFEQTTDATAKFDLVLFPTLSSASADQKNPKSSIAVDFFGRGKKGSALEYGVGGYVTKPGSPTSVYGGVNVYRADTKKLAIDLVVGYPF